MCHQYFNHARHTIGDAKKNMVKENIDYIVIWRNLNAVASDSEKKELQKWLDDDDKHRQLYKHLKDRSEQGFVLNDAYVNKQWKQIQSRLAYKAKHSLKRWVQYAAAIALPLLIAASALLLSEKEEHAELAENKIKPGATKALLKLADGSYVNLDADSKQNIHNQHGEVIASDSLNILNYHSSDQHEEPKQGDEIEYNTIEVPRGGEYYLRLADGTQVWLNSETVLSYPTRFIGQQRVVKLIGEAYFVVSSNKEKPFIVHTNHSKVKVYGTEFNVMSYADDAIEQTTLVEGSISVIHNNKELAVQPGMQAQLSPGSQEVELRQVDIDIYVDWRNGIFRFEEMPLKDVAERLSRWYDVDFYFFNEEIKTRTVSGAIKRSTDFSLFMSLIEKSTKSTITIENNSVLIKAKY